MRGSCSRSRGTTTSGRNESRAARLIDARDYCKLHIIAHYPAVLLASGGEPRLPRRPGGEAGTQTTWAHACGARWPKREWTRASSRASKARRRSSASASSIPTAAAGISRPLDSAAARLTVADVDRSAPFLRPTLRSPSPPRKCRWTPGFACSNWRRSVAPSASRPSPRARSPRRASGAPWRPSIFSPSTRTRQPPSLEGERAAADPGAFLKATADAFAKQNPRGKLLLSLGARGAYAWEGRWHHVPALPVAVKSTAGAGDALLGGTLTGLALGLPFEKAVELGSLVAAFKVTSPHTIPPDFDLAALRSFAAAHAVTLSSRLAEETR